MVLKSEFCVEGERLVDMETDMERFSSLRRKNSSLLQSSGRTRMEGEHIGGRWTVMCSPADKDVCDNS